MKKASKNNKKLVFNIQITALIVLVISAVAFALFSSRSALRITGKANPPSNSAEVFSHMIKKSQAVSYVSEKRTIKNNDDDILAVMYTTIDVRDLSKARVFTSAEYYMHDDDIANDIKVNFLETPEGTYFSFERLYEQNHSGIGAWYKVAESDTTDPVSNLLSKQLLTLQAGLEVEDITQQYFGFYVPGSYNISSRKILEQQPKDPPLYQWFSEDVTKITHNNATYYAYNFLFNSRKAIEFNQLLAEAHGINLSDSIANDLSRANNKTITFWVNTNTGYLERAELPPIEGLHQTIEYYDYNVPSIIESPKPTTKLTESVFAEFIN